MSGTGLGEVAAVLRFPVVEHNADPAFRKAMDELMVNVHQDNIMAVHAVFQRQADDLYRCLRELGASAQMRPCGYDPVSQDVLGDASFGGKIRQLFDVHWDHWRELDAVAKNLKQTALSYGHTEQEIADSVKSPPA